MSIESNATKATVERFWTHTVGILNCALVTRGTDPVTGLRAIEEEAPGTGSAGTWGRHHFILTAKHVIEQAQPSDLRFFVRQVGDLKSQHASSVTMQDAMVPLSLSDQHATIHRCAWEDLAILTIAPQALGPMLEFFDIASLWADPAEGETVAGVGYPVSNSVILEEKRVAPVIHQAAVLSPTPFSGLVLACPSEDDLRFKFNGFSPDRHYLIPYEPAKGGKRPEGISGAAVWVESSEEHAVWAPRVKFAGTCTSCYRGGAIEQIVKASVVRQFLTEVLGPPDRHSYGDLPEIPKS